MEQNKLPHHLKVQIEKEADALAKRYPGNEGVYIGKRNGIEIGYISAGDKYARQAEDLRILGDELATAARSLRLSVTAHPNYTGEPNEEWTDLVSMLDEALAEWKGEKEPAPVVQQGDAQEQITANQLAGMPLEEAIFQAGYSSGVEFQLKRQQAVGLGLIDENNKSGAVWLTGQYDRLYEQLKAEPERKIVCWVDYDWGRNGSPEYLCRDICSIMGKVMGFNARGIGYGGTELLIGDENEKAEFLEECARLHVQWLDDAGEKEVNNG